MYRITQTQLKKQTPDYQYWEGCCVVVELKRDTIVFPSGEETSVSWKDGFRIKNGPHKGKYDTERVQMK
jgi:hypothetical protein